jgi:hypothetical protein
MSLHLPTLLYVCVAVLAMSAAVMSLFGLTQRSYRGFWWWTAAQWMLTLGLLIQTVRDLYPSLLPLSNLLILQWPIVVLAGMRRFYSRHALRVPALTDWLLLALAYLAWLASWVSQASLVDRIGAFSAAALVLHLYSALMLSRIGEFRSSSALQALVGTELLAAGVQGLRLASSSFGTAPLAGNNELLLASGLVIAVSAAELRTHRAQPAHDAPQAAFPRRHRRAHPRSEPPPLPRTGGTQPGVDSAGKRGGDDVRHRSLQAHQRFARPCQWRRSAAPGRPLRA